MNEKREKYYEDGLVNFYNVKTCKEMQETANMSIEAILSQISLSDNDAWQMVTEQSKRLIAQGEQIMDLKEKLRQKEIEIKTLQLTEQARKEGTLEVSDANLEENEIETTEKNVDDFDIFQIDYNDEINLREVGDSDVD